MKVLILASAIAVGAIGTGVAHAQTKTEKGAIVLTKSKCMSMCRQRGYAAAEGKSCSHLCRPGCRNAATGERFCVK